MAGFWLRSRVLDDTVSVSVSGRPSPVIFGEASGRAAGGCKGAPVLTVGNDAGPSEPVWLPWRVTRRRVVAGAGLVLAATPAA